jgi:hypothetical protein
VLDAGITRGNIYPEPFLSYLICISGSKRKILIGNPGLHGARISSRPSLPEYYTLRDGIEK